VQTWMPQECWYERRTAKLRIPRLSDVGVCSHILLAVAGEGAIRASKSTATPQRYWLLKRHISKWWWVQGISLETSKESRGSCALT
jgi:Tfp pilus assembly protein PilN